MGKTRRKFSSEEKLKMVMAVIQDGKAVSDVAQENNVHPNMILNWKKEFLENATAVFDRHRPDITEKAHKRKASAYKPYTPEEHQRKTNTILSRCNIANCRHFAKIFTKTFGGMEIIIILAPRILCQVK